MDIEVITQIVTSVGFPIVACGGLFWYINKVTDSHKEEVKAMMDSLNQNTLVLTELKELISAIIKRGNHE